MPATAREAFAAYPRMGSVPEALTTLSAMDHEVLGHFPLPDCAWWDEFYTPMATRIADLRQKRSWPSGGMPVLDACEAESQLFRQHSDCYGYEFLVPRPRPARAHRLLAAGSAPGA